MRARGSFSRRCFQKALSLSVSLKYLARVGATSRNHVIPRHVMKCENVNSLLQKKNARALASSGIEREGKRDAAETSFALAFSPHRQRRQKEDVSRERNLAFWGTRVLNFWVFFFFVNVYTFPTATKTRQRVVFFSFFLSLLCVLSPRKTNSLLSKRALELEATSPHHRETTRRRSKTPSPVSPTGTPTKDPARKNSRRRRRKPRRKPKKKPPPREEPPRPRR